MPHNKQRILILGASGMLGHTLFRYLSKEAHLEVYGTVRSNNPINTNLKCISDKILLNIDILNGDNLMEVISSVKPDVVINCIGLVKQNNECNNPLSSITINSLFPHKLSTICIIAKCRLIHFSTDCVFSGNKGEYIENDSHDSTDLYGKTKSLGELHQSHTFTFRTSIIGHEISYKKHLVDWFLSQKNTVQGYTNAIFSGFTTIEIARIIKSFVLENVKLCGVYHVASVPITKYELLKMIAEIYGKSIEIVPTPSVKINRSLNAERFNDDTGYVPMSWPEMIAQMYSDYQESEYTTKNIW